MTGSAITLLAGSVLPLTGSGLRPEQALAMQGERIAGVGSVANLSSLAGARTVLDAGARTILPGFIDSHSHASAAATGAGWMVDCVNTCSCIEEMQQVLTENLGQAERTGWVNARGLFMANLRWKDGRYPTREDLDKVSRTVPIALRTGHISILNTRALEVVQIEKFYNTVHGSGGPVAIQRGADGQPNGRVNNLDGLLPYPEPGAADIEYALDKGMRDYYTALGVTTVCEVTDTLQSLGILQRLIEEKRVKARFKLLLRTPRMCTFEQALDWRSLGIKEQPGMFEVQGVKLFADGGYSSADAAVNGEYLPSVAIAPGSKGVLSYTDERLSQILRAAEEAGIQLAFHANGERSQEQICRLVVALGLKNSPPVRLEHAANWVWDPTTPEHWKRSGCVPVPNPMFVNLMAPAMPGFLGEFGKGKGRLPFRTLIEQGWELAAGSDATCFYDKSVSNPFFSLWCCLMRLGWDDRPIEPEEAIDLEAALKMHTVYPARLLGEERTKGTLEAGKLADVVVLDRDLRDVSPERLRDVRVDYVYLGGELVHRREGAAPLVERPRAA